MVSLAEPYDYRTSSGEALPPEVAPAVEPEVGGGSVGTPPEAPPEPRPRAARWRVPAMVVGSVAAAVFLLSVYVVLVYNDNLSLGEGWVTNLNLVTWIVLFGVALGVLLLTQLAFYVAARSEAQPEEPLVQPEATGAPLVEYVVRCHACQGEYAVKDEGLRPLAITCPHCSTTIEVGGPIASQLQVLSSEQRMKLLCTHCGSVFDVPYSTERPLHFACPACNRRGVLRDPHVHEATMEELPGIPAALPHTGEPVEFLEGIGPHYAARLADVGITHTDDLLASDPVGLAQTLNEPDTEIRKWRAMADLVRVRGIGKQYAEVLVRVGVTGVDDLVTREPAALTEAIQRDLASVNVTIEGNPVGDKMVRGWIRSAKAWERAHGKVATESPRRAKASAKGGSRRRKTAA